MLDNKEIDIIDARL